MWLCTRLGFFSIVQKPRGTWQVRARVRADLERLCRHLGWPPERILQTPGDYRWRLRLRAVDWQQMMLHLTWTVDYPNFKAAVAALPDQAPKLPAYHDFWEALARLQNTPQGIKRARCPRPARAIAARTKPRGRCFPAHNPTWPTPANCAA